MKVKFEFGGHPQSLIELWPFQGNYNFQGGRGESRLLGAVGVGVGVGSGDPNTYS